MFFGRESEKKKTLNILAENSMQTCLIYGRRRVGKSELINHCLQETNKKIYISNASKQLLLIMHQVFVN